MSTVAILNGPMVTEFIEDSEAFDDCLKQHFDGLDVDGDGVLSRSELQEGFRSVVAIEGEINNVYDSVFKMFDEDRNGTINRKEFRSLVKEIMQAVACGIGNSPVQIALEQDSLLMKAVEHELALEGKTIWQQIN